MIPIDSEAQAEAVSMLMDRDTIYLVRGDEHGRVCCYICLPRHQDSHWFSSCFSSPMLMHVWIPFGDDDEENMWRRTKEYWPNVKVVSWLHTNPFTKKYTFTVRRKSYVDPLT